MNNFYVTFKDTEDTEEVLGFAIEDYLALCTREDLLRIESVLIPIITVSVEKFDVKHLIDKNMVKYLN
jgi:hypothetical protein